MPECSTPVVGSQVLLQGGLNPDLDLGFYERMLSSIKARASVCLHSLSPAEVQYLSQTSGLGLAEMVVSDTEVEKREVLDEAQSIRADPGT